jgi:hypothetical protein
MTVTISLPSFRLLPNAEPLFSVDCWNSGENLCTAALLPTPLVTTGTGTDPAVLTTFVPPQTTESLLTGVLDFP